MLIILKKFVEDSCEKILKDENFKKFNLDFSLFKNLKMILVTHGLTLKIGIHIEII